MTLRDQVLSFVAEVRRKIRVGFVNCDLHASWYGAFMQKPDAAALMRHHKIVHYYFYNMYDAGS